MASAPTRTELENNNRQSCFQSRLKAALRYALFYIIYLVIAVIAAIVYTGSVRFKNYLKTINLNIQPTQITNVDIEDIEFKSTTSFAYPFIGALIKSDPYKFLCTAVILNTMYLISDAKCFSETAIDVHVRVGSDFWNTSGSTHFIKTFIIVSDNVPNSNGIALILINDTIKLSTLVQPANIDWTPSVISKKGVIAGWFPFQRSLWKSSSEMIEVDISIWNNNKCKHYNNNNSDYTCGTINNHKCNIVPMGPLVLQRNVIGMWYNETPCVKNPLVFYNLKFLKKWLDNFQIEYNIKPKLSTF